MDDIIQKELSTFMDKRNGLSIFEAPTGRGKTYKILKSILTYIKKDPYRKIFFLTTQKKNLPFSDLCKMYGDEKEFKEIAIRIDRNVQAFYDLDYDEFEAGKPECIKWVEYTDLKNYINAQKRRTSSNNSEIYSISREEREDNSKKEREKEQNFRYKLISFLDKKIKETTEEKWEGRGFIKYSRNDRDRELKEKRKWLIENKYQWILDLYPTVKTEDKKIFFMSMSKFIMGNTTLIENTYKFINNEIILNAIIFIDEFDATKDVLEKAINENTAKSYENKIDIFKQIYKSFLDPTIMAKDYIDSCNTKGVHYTYNTMKEETIELYKKFFPYSSMQLLEEYRNDHGNFMFNDGILHTLNDSAKSYIIAIPNPSTQKLDIKFLKRTEVDELEKSGADFIYINSLMQNLESYFRTFKNFIKRWAESYVSLKERKSRNKGKIIKLKEEDAVYSILGQFGFDKETASLLMESKLYYQTYEEGKNKANDLSDYIPDLTYFNIGFNIHSYIDAPQHYEDTIIHTLAKKDTPEKYMNYLAKHANVIGVSATALLPTYDNYSNIYLQDQLEDNYSLMSEDSLEKIQKQEDELYEEYKAKGIKINAIDLRNEITLKKDKDPRNKTYNVLRNYLDEADSRYLAHFIETSSEDDYHIARYLDIFQAMYDFWNSDTSHVWLFLNLPLLDEKNIDFKQTVVQTCLRTIVDASDKKIDAKECSEIIVVLKSSETFEKDKEQLSKDIASGKKRLVFSSYKTLMAGQNLNYKYDSSIVKDYIKIGNLEKNDPRYKTTDYDGIVLGDITQYKLHRDFTEKKLVERNKERLDLCSIIQYVYENDLISRYEQELLLRYVIQDNENGKNKNNPYEYSLNIINNTKAVQNRVLQIVMQAIGRITRTYVKNKNINIYINHNVLGALDKKEAKRHILTPELKKIYEIMPGVKESKQDEYSQRAIKNSTRANGYIKHLMAKKTGIWQIGNIEIWKNTRDIVLKNPTSDDESIYSGIYFETPDKRTKYYFAQRNDFSDVIIDLNTTTKEEFKGSKSLINFGEYKDKTIHEVSEEDCRLPTILSFPGMKEYFEKMGYATSFEPRKFILTPVIYQNIYKGVLGEVSGQYIFEKYMGIKLKEITDPSKFEVFDFEIEDGVYVDFKHWRGYYLVDRKEMIEKIKNKLDAINGKKAFIVNILAEDNFMPEEVEDSRIVIIPNLINEKDGLLNYKADELLANYANKKEVNKNENN